MDRNKLAQLLGERSDIRKQMSKLRCLEEDIGHQIKTAIMESNDQELLWCLAVNWKRLSDIVLR